MNKYLEKIASNDAKTELKQTAVIGGVGTISSIATNMVSERLGLHGPKVPNTLPAIRSKGFFHALKSPAFKKNLKIGAIGGAIGLAGDYAAVKINKRMEKSASEVSNKYLEKITEHLSQTGNN